MSKVSLLVLSVIVCVILWLIGGYLFRATAAGMICVILGITVVGLGVGNFMDTPGPEERQS
jgi:hypothetical protein